MRKDAKPAKPYPDFPLFAHAVGQWAKKVRGETRYFGPWADPDAALQRWVDERDALLAGREPRRATAGTTLADLVNGFLTHKRGQVDAGELSARMWSDYHAVCEDVIATIGRSRVLGTLEPADFARLRAAMAKRLGPVSLGVFIQRVRTVFKYGYESGLLDRPIRYGQAFDKPAKRVVRRDRAMAGSKTLTAADIQKLLAATRPPLDAMVLLGINCGFGQGDCAELPMGAVADGWIQFPRPKTGIARRCPLWPETMKALQFAMANRPAPQDPAHGRLVFLTKYGQPWVRFEDKGIAKRGVRSDSVSMEFRKLAKRAGVAAAGFYGLRHTFRTVADGAMDPVATGLIMGHHDPSMAAVYRASVDDKRLKRVTDYVHAWLYGKPRARPKK